MILISSSGGTLLSYDIRTNLEKPISILKGVNKSNYNMYNNETCRFWDVDVHPTQPTLCAAGDNFGGFSVWDIRMSSSSPLLPFFHSNSAHHGNIWKVSFVPSMPTHVLTCGDDGLLFSWDFQKNRAPSFFEIQSSAGLGVPTEGCHVSRWTENAEGLNDFDFFGSTVVVATESESLLFMYNVLEAMGPEL